MSARRGYLVAFEGLDQSGKQTQATGLCERLAAAGHACRLLSFPDYETPIGQELARALRGERDYGPEVMQLLYVANRFERRDQMAHWLGEGVVVVCDRYTASSVAYGEAHGLDPAWLVDIQRGLPPADLTVLLDVQSDTASGRKALNRDRYERDLALLDRVRASYIRQAAAPGWALVEAARDRDVVADEVARLVQSRLWRP